jgi:molybdopterin-guanine dinucleotide biosynthesis protein A
MDMAKRAIVGCILAGGRSRRMGRDKRLELLGGKPLIAHAIDRLRGQVDRLMINAEDEMESLAIYGLPVRGDSVPGFAGPLAGILAGLLWAVESKAEGLVTVPSDSPFFPHDLVARLAMVPDCQIACAASDGRLHPVFGLWHLPSQFTAGLEKALRSGERKVESFVSRYRQGVAAWPIGRYDPFFNINTPADLAAAERLLAGGAT